MASYWVNSILGNDSTGDGSVANPWQTIPHALSNITPDTTLEGDIIFLIGTHVLSAPLNTDTYAPAFNKKLLFISRGLSTLDDGKRTLIKADSQVVSTSVSDYLVFESIEAQWGIVTSSAVGFLVDDQCVFKDCVFDGRNASTNSAIQCGNDCRVIDCYIHSMNGGNALSVALHSDVVGNYVDARNCSSGILGARQALIKNNIVLANAGMRGIQLQYGTICDHNSVICIGTLGTSDGIRQNANERSCITNNYIENFTNAINNNSSNSVPFTASGNRYFNCTNGVVGANGMDIDNTSLLTKLYADAENGDFTIHTRAGAARQDQLNGEIGFVGAVQSGYKRRPRLIRM